jgi:hypothetical protein
MQKFIFPPYRRLLVSPRCQLIDPFPIKRQSSAVLRFDSILCAPALLLNRSTRPEQKLIFSSTTPAVLKGILFVLGRLH